MRPVTAGAADMAARNQEAGELTCTTPTSLALPDEAMAEAAMELMLAQLQGQGGPATSHPAA